MLSAVVKSWALFLGIALLMLGNGLQGSLLGLRAGLEGFTPASIGAVMAGYYGGFLLGSIVTPLLVRRVGHIRVFAALASLASTSVLLFAVFLDAAAWLAIRVLSGFCIAGLYVVCESWLNNAATNENRGKLLSIYMIVLFAFMGLGQFLLNVADPAGFVLFILVSALISVSLVPVALTSAPGPQIARFVPVSVRELYRISPLGTVACLLCGVAQGAFFSMTAVYATQIGLSVAKASLLLSVPFLGVVFLQFPIGFISDRYDRRMVLAAAALLSVGLALGCVVAADRSLVALAALFAVFGGLSLPIYSIAIAHANDYLEEDQRLGAGAKLVLLSGFGSMFGPLIVGPLMQAAGAVAFLYYMAGVYATIALFSLYRRTRTVPVAPDDKGDFVLVSTRMTPVAAASAMLDPGEDPDAGGAAPTH